MRRRETTEAKAIGLRLERRGLPGFARAINPASIRRWWWKAIVIVAALAVGAVSGAMWERWRTPVNIDNEQFMTRFGTYVQELSNGKNVRLP